MVKQKSKKQPGAQIFIEGLRLCTDALISDVCFVTTIISESCLSQMDLSTFENCSQIIVFSDSLFKKICSTNNPQGIAAIVKSPVLYSLNELVIKPQDSFLICESIQDPGNLGSIIRTADAFGFAGIIFTRDTVDPFNEKVLRSSMGSIFHIKLINIDSIIEAASYLKENGVTIYVTDLDGTDLSKDFIFKIPCAIIMGNEGKGITEDASVICDSLVRIPMKGNAESLNVSNAAAILCYLVSMQ